MKRILPLIILCVSFLEAGAFSWKPQSNEDLRGDMFAFVEKFIDSTSDRKLAGELETFLARQKEIAESQPYVWIQQTHDFVDRLMERYPAEISDGGNCSLERRNLLLLRDYPMHADNKPKDAPQGLKEAYESSVRGLYADADAEALLIKDLQKQLGMSVILITHDLGVVAEMCDEVIVMYAGEVCERGTADEIFYNPKHEYTKGLLRSIPSVNDEGHRLEPIGGTPVDLLNMPDGCPFAPRCDNAMKVCLFHKAKEMLINNDHAAACWQNIKNAIEAGELTQAQVEEMYNNE